MNSNMVKSFLSNLWRKMLDHAQKPSTWLFLGGGIAGGALIRQPKVNKLKKEVRAARSSEKRLKAIIYDYHEAFIVTKAKMEVLQAKNNIDEAKKKERYGRSLILYQYATKEYIEICLKTRYTHGKDNLSVKEINHYRIFQRVLNGEELVQEDARSIQNYIYPKYKRQIDGLIEYDFGNLLEQMTMI